MGAYTVALLIPMVLTQLLNLGMPSANIYFLGSRQFNLEEVWGTSRDLMILSAILGSILALGAIHSISGIIFPGVPKEALLIGIIIYPLSLMATLFSGIFQALREFRKYNLLVLIEPSVTIFLMAGTWIFGAGSLNGFLWATVSGFLSSFFAGLYLLSRKTNVFTIAISRREYARTALRYGLIVNGGNFITFLNYRVDALLVNLFLGPQATGIYTLATRLGEQIWMVSQAVSTVAFPQLSSLNNLPAKRDRLTIDVARITLWITAVACIILILLSGPLLNLFFQPDFEPARYVLAWLLPGTFVLAGSRILANGLAAQGRVRINFYFSLIIFLTNLVLNILLIPLFGFVGAAIATSLSYGTDFVLRIVLVKKMFNSEWWRIFILTRNDFKFFYHVASIIFSNSSKPR